MHTVGAKVYKPIILESGNFYHVMREGVATDSTMNGEQLIKETLSEIRDHEGRIISDGVNLTSKGWYEDKAEALRVVHRAYVRWIGGHTAKAAELMDDILHIDLSNHMNGREFKDESQLSDGTNEQD